ncbi:MAG: hypothetical protein ACP5GI_07745 [Sulfolobales archaeon]
MTNSLVECFNKLVENTDLETRLIETRSRYLEKQFMRSILGKEITTASF